MTPQTEPPPPALLKAGTPARPEDVALWRRTVYVLDLVEYRDWSFEMRQGRDGDGRIALRVSFFAADTAQPGAPLERQFGRWWLITHSMTNSEIVQTAFLAIKTAEEHELREHFRFRGEPIFGPHFSVDALAKLSWGGNRDARKAPTPQDPPTLRSLDDPEARENPLVSRPCRVCQRETYWRLQDHRPVICARCDGSPGADLVVALAEAQEAHDAP